jgi:hypothetical protein
MSAPTKKRRPAIIIVQNGNRIRAWSAFDLLMDRNRELRRFGFALKPIFSEQESAGKDFASDTYRPALLPHPNGGGPGS